MLPRGLLKLFLLLIFKKYDNSMVFQNCIPLEILNRNKAETLTLLYIHVITVTLLSKK